MWAFPPSKFRVNQYSGLTVCMWQDRQSISIADWLSACDKRDRQTLNRCLQTKPKKAEAEANRNDFATPYRINRKLASRPVMPAVYDQAGLSITLEHSSGRRTCFASLKCCWSSCRCRPTYARLRAKWFTLYRVFEPVRRRLLKTFSLVNIIMALADIQKDMKSQHCRH